MYALLRVIKKGYQNQTLVFASEHDAQRFQDFLYVFIRQSGAGNGYGSYWPAKGHIEYSKVLASSYCSDLDYALVKEMLDSIVSMRTAREGDAKQVDINIGTNNGAITFALGALPDVKHPQVGDQCFVFRAEDHDKFMGKVVGVREGTFLVAQINDIDENGKMKEGAETISVKAGNTVQYPVAT